MRSDVEQAIRKFYLTQTWHNPFSDALLKKKAHDYQQSLYEVIGALRKADKDLEHATASDLALCENILFASGVVNLKLSFLGPFAYLNVSRKQSLVHTQLQLLISKIELLLEKYEILLLQEPDMHEYVSWMSGDRPITVKECLFGEGEK